MNSLLEVQQLSLFLQSSQGLNPILENINFSVCPGETLALVGESGSGKSLTALTIMQLLPRNSFVSSKSKINLKGKDLLEFPEVKMQKVRGRRIAMIFQEAITALNPVLTIGFQISESLKKHFPKESRGQRFKNVLMLLEEVGFPDPAFYYAAYPHELSGGLKQRALIAIALAGQPDLLIADEPTTALDVTLQAQIIKLIKKIQQKRNMGLLFITHDLGLVYQVANQVAVMHKGRVIEKAPVNEFFEHPQQAYSRHLLQVLPKSRGQTEKEAFEKEIILEVKDLKVFFPIRKGIIKHTVGYVKAVKDVSFSLAKGQTLSLVGESGSGKTSAALAILHLVPITGGKILFQSRDISQATHDNLKFQHKRIQIVFQDPYSSMNPRMLVEEILAEGMLAQKIFKNMIACRPRIHDLLEKVGLDASAADRYPHEFSGGQRQRICIARALAVNPTLLILDEPTSALDMTSQMQILDLLLRLQNELGLCYLLITHNFSVVSYMANEVAVLRRGEIVEYGNVNTVLQHPQHAYTRKLLGAIPKIPIRMTSKN